MEGADFAFDTADMDFNNVFATLPQQQQFAKPTEDNTFGFFGDEGIDTAASFIDPTIFSTPSQDMSFMSQTLAMDNTMSNNLWNSHLTPETLAMNSFPATPTQSLEMYQPSLGTSLGKRPRQLDVEDFTQSKRHESTGDYTLTSFSSASPQIDVVQGLSDEAADVCTTWFNKYAVLPSDRHIDSLSQLTGESADAIRQWFGLLLKQGMGGHDSAYKSQTDMMPALCWSDSYTTDLVPQQQQGIEFPVNIQNAQLTQNTATPERRTSDDTTVANPPAPTLRGKKKRCSPTEDRDLLDRDPNKIYQCTRKCGKRYGRKCDWKRNEEEGYPCKSWVCSLCTSDGVENVRPCFRKYHFVQHFRNIHPDVNSDEYEQASVVSSETEFPRNCGFCKHKFDSRQDRIDHIAEHFKQGKCMLDWNDESNDDADNSDNTDDDDDNDKPSGDGYDGAPSHPPRESDPRNHFGSHYYGGGDYGGGGSSSSGGSGSSLLPDSFFQFQLSSKSENVDVAKQPQGDQQRIRQRSSSTPEPISTELCSTGAKHASTARNDPITLAGDAISGRLVGGAKVPSQPLVARGVCVSTDGVGLIPDAVNRQLAVLETQTDPAGRNTKISPLESSVQSRTEELRVPVSAVLDNRTDLSSSAVVVVPTMHTKTTSSTVLDALQHFTPQSFLSVRLLGAGGFSTVDEVVHRATNLRMGRKTLKNRNPTAIEELKKEVSVLQKLRHPHVIRLLGAYSKGDKMSILVSPVAETTLALWLEQVTLQPANLVNVVSKMFGCLVSSVRYLHEQRPVVKHMDIKPQNILVLQGDQEFPRVVLCDFGISSSDDLNDGQHKPLTRRYVAPEVFNGFAREQAADVWSLGCVFAEMASAPFSPSNSDWLDFRREYSGRTGKHYWQDVPSLQDRLSRFLKEAATPTEVEVVGTLKEMLNADPTERPSAALLSLKFTPAPCCLEWPNDQAVFPAPDQELEAVETLVRKNGVDCCDHLEAASITVNHSQDIFKNAKSWIEECYHTHDVCRTVATTDKVLPTRLVDTQPEGIDDSSVRIVDSASLVQGIETLRYVTLSHIWTCSSPTLTTDRLKNAQLGLQRQALPKALESGIQAVQKLGFRYIWVDSLCIVQDSEADKYAECAKMASVYRNAALTIVLDQIDEGDPAITKMASGLVPPNANANALAMNANAQDNKVNVLSKNANANARLSASSSLPVSDFTTPGFGWDTRAWALQERLLSSRLLHLCEKQLYWECASLKASDTFPRGLSSLLWEKTHSKARHDSPQRGKSGSQSITVKNTFDTPVPLEATRLRNCQWIHKEGTVNGDSLDVAHTTQRGAPLSSDRVSALKHRKTSSNVVAPSTKSAIDAACTTNDQIGSFNASGPWTGTPAPASTRTALARAPSPYMKHVFALTSLSDNARPHFSGAFKKPADTRSAPNAARLSPQAPSHTPTTSSASKNEKTAMLRASRPGVSNPPFYDSDNRLVAPATAAAAAAATTKNPLCDALAHTLAHQLESGVRSHPCARATATAEDDERAQEDGTKV
ncbi:hypothetical protein C7974DRAFT_328572 [Boeremia exigua]|uniref:uncharacterized protein n=1 Tax=Boeremia exigua TaxID=749465 RepID=UPI001E8EF10B|nr:uncharacterized protein C7974DRAFT_328572 [Boeremia exigua]KAH6642882.1 hypothetical protein C7974DRAFT_328572 [Boeremia exigua]